MRPANGETHLENETSMLHIAGVLAVGETMKRAMEWARVKIQVSAVGASTEGLM